jgi:hypothetical protein
VSFNDTCAGRPIIQKELSSHSNLSISFFLFSYFNRHSDWIFKRTGKRVKPNQTYQQRPKKRQPSERSPPRARRDSKYEMSFDDVDLIERSARRSDPRRHDDRRPHSSRDHRSNHRPDPRAHHDSRHDHSRRRSRSPARRHR